MSSRRQPTTSSTRSHRRGRRGGLRSDHPPMIRSNVIVNHTFRFTSTAATPTTISALQAGLAAGIVATGAHTSGGIYQSVKVNSVKIWAPPPSQGTTSTCSVEWVSSSQSQVSNLEVSDTTNSVSTPAMVKSRPPRQSLASFWQQLTVGNILFTLTAPVGSIIDVSLSLIMQDDNSAVATYAPTAAATATHTYYLSLDNGGLFPPVSLTTIV